MGGWFFLVFFFFWGGGGGGGQFAYREYTARSVSQRSSMCSKSKIGQVFKCANYTAVLDILLSPRHEIVSGH